MPVITLETMKYLNPVQLPSNYGGAHFAKEQTHQMVHKESVLIS